METMLPVGLIRNRIAPANIPLLATTAVCAVLYAACSLLYPGFFSLKVFLDFLSDNSFLGIIAVGMTLVIISGGIDLSVGSVMALCSITIAVLVGPKGFHPIWAMGIVLLIGASIGFIMGFIIHVTKLAPFIVTLAGLFLARGLAYVMHIEALPIQNAFYQRASEMGISIGSTKLSITAIIFLGVVAIGTYIAGHTVFGRNLYAIGGNEEAAVLMGLPVGQTKLKVYTMSGLCSALAAVVFTLYQSAGNPSAGVGLELDAIAVVVVGGTLLSGGAGSVFGTLIGTLILGIIQAGIIFQGTLSSWWTKVAIGLLLLGFIVLQKLLARHAFAASAQKE